MAEETVWLDFTVECPVCGQTVNFLNGERVPSSCDHRLPAVVVDGDNAHIDWGDAEPDET